ncbi:predicted protein [Histoplasma capsulatum H143]|uniref:Uncharacterized protein n=1 Tax=Ajellomyces capsulatus (strain H143) TaxID=544712 RepID=C6H3Q6_AJECH|nr:predicted protein [Histoplasma capsulatum H143]
MEAVVVPAPGAWVHDEEKEVEKVVEGVEEEDMGILGGWSSGDRWRIGGGLWGFVGKAVQRYRRRLRRILGRLACFGICGGGRGGAPDRGGLVASLASSACSIIMVGSPTSILAAAIAARGRLSSLSKTGREPGVLFQKILLNLVRPTVDG